MAVLALVGCGDDARPEDGGRSDTSSDAGADAFDASTGECSTRAECDDGFACTIDDCEEGSCVHDPCTDCCPDALECVEGRGCTTRVACEENDDCIDGTRCTLDRCADDGYCAFEPANDLCEAGEICLAELGCIPAPPDDCDTDEDCTGGNLCVGEWSCQVEFGCQFVAGPDCDDGDECTTDRCPIDEGVCINDAPIEMCSGVDDDCDGTIDEGCCTAGEDCDTECGSVGMTTCMEPVLCEEPPEACNGVDDDCDGLIEEGFTCTPDETSDCPTTCGSTGTRSCTAGCMWDSCIPPAEVCNGVDDDCDLACDDGFTCCRDSTRDCTALGMGFTGGTAVCAGDCGGYVTTGCNTCGNGNAEGGEACDGGDLDGESCTSIGMGFGGGTLSCRGDCSFDVGGCSRCNNGMLDVGEQCDGALLGGANCTTVGGGFTGGTLGCNTNCTYDTSGCEMFDPTGTYTMMAPAPSYQCAFDGLFCGCYLVNVMASSLTITDDGTTVTVSGGGLNCNPVGPSARTSMHIVATCTVGGSCDETYTLDVTFSDDDTFMGTLSAMYTPGPGPFADCADCTNRSWSVTGTR